MRTRIVPANELDQKDLRASRYVANPKRMARELVQRWSGEFGGVVNTRSPAGKCLMVLVEEAIREGMRSS